MTDGQTLDRHVLTVHIEGIGPLNGITNPSGRLGYLWTTESPYSGDTDGLATFQPVDQSGAGAATIRDDELDVDRISSVGTSINVFDAQITFSSFGLPLRGNDFNVELLTHAKRTAAFETTSDTLKTDTSIDTNATGGELTGTVGFIRDESVYFKSHSGGGTYTVKRGYYLSTPQFQAASTNIFDDVPNWEKRKVRLYTWRVEPSPVQLERRDVLLIDGSTEHDHNNIVVNATGYGSFLQQATANRDTFFGREQLAEDGAAITTEKLPTTSPEEDKIYDVKGSLIFDSDGESKIVKQNEYSDGDDIRTWVQLNTDLLIPYDGGEFNLQNFINVNFNGSVGQTQGLPFGQTMEENVPKDVKRIWEPFVVSRAFDEKQGKIFSSTREITQFSNHDDKYIYHAVSIAGALLLSSYAKSVDAQNFDVLHGNWSAGSYSSLVDGLPGDIRQLVENHPRDQVDYLTLGLGGQTVNVWGEITDLLKTYGYYWAVKSNGQITIKKVTNNTTDFWSAAQTNPVQPVQSDTLKRTNGRSEVVDILEGTIGKIPNFQEPVPVQVRIIDRQDPRRTNQLSENTDRTIQMDSISVGNVQRAQRMLEAKAFLQSFSLPKFQFKVDDFLNLDPSTDRNYSLGAEVSIKKLPLSRAWITREGSRQRISKDDIKFAGRIIARDFLPKERAYALTVEIIGISGLARWRAPSGVVKSVDLANNTITLEHKNNGGGEVLRGAEPFVAGDEIQIFTEDGKQVDPNIQEIQSISGDTLTLDGFNYTTNPSAGNLVELSFLDINQSGTGYSNMGRLANIDRPYVALADTDSTIGDNDADADIYGEG